MFLHYRDFFLVYIAWPRTTAMSSAIVLFIARCLSKFWGIDSIECTVHKIRKLRRTPPCFVAGKLFVHSFNIGCSDKNEQWLNVIIVSHSLERAGLVGSGRVNN